MGEVYLALDEAASEGSPDRQVAVKMIRRTRTGAAVSATEAAKVAARFAREVRIMRRPHHPNLPRVIDGGLDAGKGGLHYLAMAAVARQQAASGEYGRRTATVPAV